jgi:PAS domain S-box-containing protein
MALSGEVKYGLETTIKPPVAVLPTSTVTPSKFSLPSAVPLRRFGRVPLYLVMVLPLLIQVVGVVGVVGWLSYKNGQRAVNEVATQLRDEAGSRIHQHLDDYLTAPVQINQTNAAAAELGLLDLTNYQTTGAYFWRQMKTFDVGYISFGRANGDFIGIERRDNGDLHWVEVSPATQGKAHEFATNGQGDRTRQLDSRTWFPKTEVWYSETVKLGKPTWSPIYQWDDKPEVLSVSANYPLYDRDRRLLGVLSVDQILTQISQFLHQIKVSNSARTYIVERSGDLVATSTPSEKPFRLVNGAARRLNADDSDDPLIRDSAVFLRDRFSSLSAIQGRQQLEFQSQGNRQFLLVMPWREQTGLDWLIVVVVPESDFMAQIHDNTRNTILSCFSALLMATLLGIPTSRWIAKQILQLSQASEALANGQLHHTVEANGIAELETLASSFNRMAQQLRESFATLEQTNEMLEQRVAERTASLVATQAELQALFAAMPDVVLVYDRTGRCLKSVSAHPDALILPADEQVGKFVQDILPSAPAELVLHTIQQALNHYRVLNVEYSLPMQGHETWYSANVAPLSSDSVLWVARDVSDRKRMEAANQRNVARLQKQNRILLELAKSPVLIQGDFQAAAQEITAAAVRTLEIEQASIWLLNNGNTTLICLDQFESASGHHSHGMTLTATDYPHYFQALEEEANITADDVFSDRRTSEFIESYFKQTGVTSLLDTPIRSGGNIVGVFCLEQVSTPHSWTVEEQSFARSIADLIALGLAAQARTRTEQALYEKEQYLRLILNNIPQQVFWKDTQSMFLGCNQNWAAANDLPNPEAIIGKTDFDLLVDPTDAELFRAQDQLIISTDEPQIHVVAPKVKPAGGKTVWLDICKVPIHDANQQVIGVLGVIEDITHRKEAEEALKAEQEKSERLLLNVLPMAIADRLKQSLGNLEDLDGNALIAEQFDEVTVLFADIVNFTSLSSNVLPAELVGLLNQIFLVFDDLCEQHGLEKIKTIGDAYMAVGGLPNPRTDHAAAIADMALDMQRAITQFHNLAGEPISVRIGINTGPVVAGVIGKKKFTYDLWGDVVNTASRMESHGLAGYVQVTETTYHQLKHQYQFQPRGTIEVKGKGKMPTYWLIGKADPSVGC